MRHLVASGLAQELLAAAARGQRIHGVCGGLQLLGRSIRDPDGLEGGDQRGRGLLELETVLEREKVTGWRTARDAFWNVGATVRGYEIHHGRTRAGKSAEPILSDGLGWRTGSVSAVVLHGIAEDTEWRRAFLESLGWRGTPRDWGAELDRELDRVARHVEEAWDVEEFAPARGRS